MKIGIIVRSENRGLGLQTWEAWRYLDPAATLHVEMGDLARGFPSHPERYPGCVSVSFDGHRFDNTDTVKDFLAAVDVVYTAETPYDWRLCRWAEQAGTAVVVQTNPELHRLVAERDGYEPTVWWNPTDWHMDLLTDPAWTEAPVVEMPMPVALDRFDSWSHHTSDRPTFLHVMGHKAIGDRNGAATVARTLRRVNDGQRWIIRHQDPSAFTPPPASKADVTVLGPVADYWDLYTGADVLVMPRKYGGLCLPVNEAMAAGLAVVMSDCSPNRRWPIVPVLAEHPGKMNRRGILAYSPNFVDLGVVCDRLDDDPEQVATAKAASWVWAQANSWEALLPVWLEGLADATNRL